MAQSREGEAMVRLAHPVVTAAPIGVAELFLLASLPRLCEKGCVSVERVSCLAARAPGTESGNASG